MARPRATRHHGGVTVAAAVRTERAGDLLREWRRRRRVSQLELASTSAVSTRHLSFIETGRARPSREMLIHLAERLDMPLRERNRLLLAAGFAPVYAARTLDDPEMAPVREAVERFLAAHEPYPAAVHDQRWTLVAANRGMELLVAGVDPKLLAPPANVLRATLHPDGAAPRIANFAQWSGHLLRRLEREVSISGDPELAALRDEFLTYPGVRRDDPSLYRDPGGDIVVPLRIEHPDGELRFFTTVTSFGTPVDLTVAELTIEAFYPADAETAGRLTALVPPA
jgi:transcriptional regulator with XRE-family HTH domain